MGWFCFVFSPGFVTNESVSQNKFIQYQFEVKKNHVINLDNGLFQRAEFHWHIFKMPMKQEQFKKKILSVIIKFVFSQLIIFFCWHLEKFVSILAFAIWYCNKCYKIDIYHMKIQTFVRKNGGGGEPQPIFFPWPLTKIIVVLFFPIQELWENLKILYCDNRMFKFCYHNTILKINK